MVSFGELFGLVERFHTRFTGLRQFTCPIGDVNIMQDSDSMSKSEAELLLSVYTQLRLIDFICIKHSTKTETQVLSTEVSLNSWRRTSHQ